MNHVGFVLNASSLGIPDADNNDKKTNFNI